MGWASIRAGYPLWMAQASVLLLMLAPRPGHGEALPADARALMCGARASCSVVAAHPAGTTQRGDPLTIVQLRFALADRPKDAPDSGCRDGDRSDGGTEYWLMRGGQQPRLMLALCNDGYGASGVGDDEVEIGDNRLVHRQAGGSAWRWDVTRTLRLVPPATLAERRCSYHVGGPDIGATTDIDFTTLTVRSVAKDSAAKWRDDDGPGCPDWPARRFAPQPAPRLVAGYNLVRLAPAGDGAATAVPRGTTLGSCALTLTTDGEHGFLVFGKPAGSAAAAAEIKAIAESDRSLVIQVFDPARPAAPAAPPASWIHLPHLELWLAPGGDVGASRPDPERLQQIVIDLDGKAYGATDRAVLLPAVERWNARDAAGRPVTVLRLTWPDDEPLMGGVGLVYSQPEAGKQARLVATMGIVRNRPLYLPPLVALPGSDDGPAPPRCVLRDGRLTVETGN